MAATVQGGWILQLIHLLPRPVLRALDRWSQRVAQRHDEQRQLRWRQRQQAAAVPAPAPQRCYHLKPWRD